MTLALVERRDWMAEFVWAYVAAAWIVEALDPSAWVRITAAVRPLQEAV